MDTEYIKMCEKAEKIQESWLPTVGDWVWRKYSVFGEELNSQIWAEDKMHEIIVLHFKSSVEGYWAAVNKDGEERIFKTPEDLWKQTSIWLPLEHQLQDMVLDGHRYSNLSSLLQDFNSFVFRGYPRMKDEYAVHLFPSMKQLWLAFVYKELYNKVWNDEEWIL